MNRTARDIFDDIDLVQERHTGDAWLLASEARGHLLAGRTDLAEVALEAAMRAGRAA